MPCPVGVVEGEIVQKHGLSAFVNFDKKVGRTKVRKYMRAYPTTMKSTIYSQLLYLVIPWNICMELELLLKCCSIQSQIPTEK